MFMICARILAARRTRHELEKSAVRYKPMAYDDWPLYALGIRMPSVQDPAVHSSRPKPGCRGSHRILVRHLAKCEPYLRNDADRIRDRCRFRRHTGCCRRRIAASLSRSQSSADRIQFHPQSRGCPILVLWFGIGTVPAVLTAFLVAFFP